MTKLALVDANNLLVRGIRATDRRPMQTEDGVSTAALLTFINSLARHLREVDPDQVVVCWDGGRSRFRAERSGGTYKANRPQRDDGKDDPEGPYALARQFLALANIPQAQRAGWEADDLIAAYAVECAWDEPPADDRPPVWRSIVIVSSDHDLLQLVDRRGVVQARIGNAGTIERWDAARVEAHYGVADSTRLNMVMGLAGDPGDGVPGLPRIGEKKAVQMLEAAGWDWLRLMSTFDAEGRRHEGRTWREIAEETFELTDLCQRAWQEMGLVVAQPGEFRPTRPGDVLYDSLLGFLRRYELATIEDRLAEGRLWPPGRRRREA